MGLLWRGSRFYGSDERLLRVSNVNVTASSTR